MSNSFKKPRIKLECDYCGKSFERLENKLKISKSGLHFCSRKCKDEAQRIKNNFTDIWPSHYKNGESVYRRTAFDEYEHKCEVCGYNQHIELLQVHHIDSDRNNNDIKNLIILCPTCHWSLTQKLAALNEDRKYVWN